MTRTLKQSVGMAASEVGLLTDMIAYGEQSIVSRTLINQPAGSLTLFAFDAGQRLSEHTSPYDAFANVIEGETEFVIGGRSMRAVAGEAVLMPANVPHAVNAPEQCKMLLAMFKSPRE